MVALGVAVAVAAPAARAGTPAGGALRPAATTVEADIGQIYRSDCAVCHGPQGRGTSRGTTLVGVGRASLHYQLTTGRMPLAGVGRDADSPGAPLRPLPNTVGIDPDIVPRRHEPAYDPSTITALIDYVDALTGGGGPDIPDPRGGDVAEGGELFRLNCAACHAWAGEGGALLRRTAPSVLPATDVQVAEAIRVGPSQMPAFGLAALTDEQVASVVAYVRYLQDPRNRGGLALGHLGPFAEGAVALAAVAALMLFLRWIGERG